MRLTKTEFVRLLPDLVGLTKPELIEKFGWTPRSPENRIYRVGAGAANFESGRLCVNSDLLAQVYPEVFNPRPDRPSPPPSPKTVIELPNPVYDHLVDTHRRRNHPHIRRYHQI